MPHLGSRFESSPPPEDVAETQAALERQKSDKMARQLSNPNLRGRVEPGLLRARDIHGEVDMCENSGQTLTPTQLAEPKRPDVRVSLLLASVPLRVLCLYLLWSWRFISFRM